MRLIAPSHTAVYTAFALLALRHLPVALFFTVRPTSCQLRLLALVQLAATAVGVVVTR